MILNKYYFLKPQYIIFIFDYNRKNFRNKIYSNYKRNRKSISLHLLRYIYLIRKKLNNWGINYYTIPYVEGDDVIGTLIKNFLNKKEYKIYILSYDKDLLQLINKNIYMLITKKNIFNKKKVFQKYGIYPNLFKDMLILCGDKSDNIPGIKGIGIKTASLLLNNIGNINNIYNNLNKIKELKIKNYLNIIKNLKNNYNNINIWNNLISLKTNLKINFKLKNFLVNFKLLNNILNKINLLKI